VNENPVKMIEHEPVDVETTLIDYEEVEETAEEEEEDGFTG